MIIEHIFYLSQDENNLHERALSDALPQGTQLKSLKVELAEFICKRGYRFRDEMIGKEGDSCRRSAELLNEKYPPATKKELGH
ncbi:MAG: hypothetical protein ABIF04_02380 [Chloroflexota bacterium]